MALPPAGALSYGTRGKLAPSGRRSLFGLSSGQAPAGMARVLLCALAWRGAAETVRIGLEGLSASQRSRPTMLVDGDAFYTVDIVSMYRAISTKAGGSFCFRDTQPKPIYSYVTCVRGVRTIASIDASRRWRAGGVDVRRHDAIAAAA